MASMLKSWPVWLKALAAHLGASLILGPYQIWRFQTEPYGLDHGAPFYQKVGFMLADYASGLLQPLARESLYTDGFTGKLDKPVIFHAEPDLNLYALIAVCTSLIIGVAVRHFVSAQSSKLSRAEPAI